LSWVKKYKQKDNVIKLQSTFHPIKDFRMDSSFVLIRIQRTNKLIELALVDSKLVGDKYEITHIISGHTPQDIYWEVAKNNLLTYPEHYAYLGKELQKAYTSLLTGSDYKQD
jgi:hypothetical protein